MTWSRFVSIIFLLIILSCSGGLLTISLSESAETTIEGQSTLGDLAEALSGIGFDGFTDMDISQSSTLSNQGVSPGDIESAYVTNFQLDVTSPEDGDLSFISSLQVWVDATDLPPVLVASQNNFPEGEHSVQFNLEDVNLVDYVVSDSMNISTEVTATVPSETTVVVATVDFDVDVTSQGACNALKE